MDGHEQFIGARELSLRLGIPKATLYRMSKRKMIPSIPVGVSLGGIRFLESAVREALATLTQPPRAYHPRKERHTEVRQEWGCSSA